MHFLPPLNIFFPLQFPRQYISERPCQNIRLLTFEIRLTALRLSLPTQQKYHQVAAKHSPEKGVTAEQLGTAPRV